METERQKRIEKLIDELANDLADLVAWPDSKSTREIAEASIKQLRKGFKEESTPHMLQVLAVLHVAGWMYRSSTVRKTASDRGYKDAWLALAEALP
jgi:hypothetical protein